MSSTTLLNNVWAEKFPQNFKYCIDSKQAPRELITLFSIRRTVLTIGGSHLQACAAENEILKVELYSYITILLLVFKQVGHAYLRGTLIGDTNLLKKGIFGGALGVFLRHCYSLAIDQIRHFISKKKKYSIG